MKLIDMLVEKSLITSVKFSNAVKAVSELAHHVQSVAVNLRHLAQIVSQHETMLRQLLHVNSTMMQDIKDGSMDLSLPKTKQKENKPN